MKFGITKAVGMGLVAGALIQNVQAAPQAYVVHELGAVQGGMSEARGLSSNGKAAGYVSFEIEGGIRPAYFQLGQLPVVIATDGPGTATGVNAGGEVVGSYTQGGTSQAFRWKGNVLTPLPGLGGGGSHAAAINDRSEIVGWAEVAPGVRHAAYFFGGKAYDLGSWGGVNSQATAINANGDIVGFREVEIDGVLVKQGVRVPRGGKARLLRATPAGFDALVPLSINENGDVAGVLHRAGALPHETQGFTLINGAFKRLGTDGCCTGFPSQANSINRAGQAVGFKFDGNADPRKLGRGWERNARPVALDALPEATAGAGAHWHALGEASAINDRGVIVGVGQTGERALRAYMLVPKR
ncbi:hypothetical protein [Azohydromonas aeria]|uniref:hypothetical protein n=1 Tax=Azohydromonas aeria TaxID=2590212 RepID=UPI0012FBFC1E|nr:hypothetical protein [Azohydromonas aeria]